MSRELASDGALHDGPGLAEESAEPWILRTQIRNTPVMAAPARTPSTASSKRSDPSQARSEG